MAAIMKFSEKGYQGTNISEIVQELDLSQGIIFWYFETKEKLYKTAFMKEFKEIKFETANLLYDPSSTPLERLRKLISEMIKVYYERKEGCMLILQMLSNTEIQQILSIDILNVNLHYKKGTLIVAKKINHSYSSF